MFAEWMVHILILLNKIEKRKEARRVPKVFGDGREPVGCDEVRDLSGDVASGEEG